MINLDDLLIRSAQRDQAAFKTLYNATSPKLFGVLVGMMRNESLAEEVLQDSYLKIWEKAEKYQSSKSGAMTWMRTIATNTARDKLRALKVRHYQDECGDYIENIEGSEASLDNQLSIDHELSRVSKALKKLKAPHRECLILSYYHGYSHAELAKKLNLPLGTIKTWIRLGREELIAAA